MDRPDVEKMVNNPPAEVVGLKNKAEEPSKDEPATKKARTDQTLITSAVATTQPAIISVSWKERVYG